MPLPGTRSEIYRFGPYELAQATGELRKHGLRLKLQDQPVRLLVLLLENAGEVVSREQIQERLWASDVHVDYENAINSAVRKLREVLIDTSENPRFVETLARRGYRFIAPVVRMPAASLPAEPPVAPVEIPVLVAGKRRLNWFWAVVAVVAVVAVGGASWFWLGRGGAGPSLQAMPLTSSPGYESWPSFSPDGTQVAFAAGNGGKGYFDIYVQLIGSVQPLRLTTDPADHVFPVWSPDGRSIAFGSLDKVAREVTIQLIPALGGAEREVASLGKSYLFAIGGWSPDGRRLLISWQEKADAPEKLFWVSADTGEKQRLTSPPSGTLGDQWASISPDGKTIAFTRAQGLGTNGQAGNIGDLYVLALTSDFAPKGEPKRLTFDNAGMGGIAWTADSREIIFSSSRGGSVALWRMPVSNAEKPRRLEVGENGMRLAVSQRSRRLIYELLIAPDTNIWRLDLSAPDRPAVSLIASTRPDQDAQYSPDGKRIVFRSGRSGSNEIWMCDANGSSPVQLTSRGPAGSPHWSPDGRFVAFDSLADGRWQIFVMGASGGRQQQITQGQGGYNARPNWSHDGKWLYFSSNRTGRLEVWKVPAGGGSATQVTKNGETTLWNRPTVPRSTTTYTERS
jgi:Tol biopolymer transport system component/DNA-binding winged helix-turn-helix (wHTH) protein